MSTVDMFLKTISENHAVPARHDFFEIRVPSSQQYHNYTTSAGAAKESHAGPARVDSAKIDAPTLPQYQLKNTIKQNYADNAYCAFLKSRVAEIIGTAKSFVVEKHLKKILQSVL